MSEFDIRRRADAVERSALSWIRTNRSSRWIHRRFGRAPKFETCFGHGGGQPHARGISKPLASNGPLNDKIGLCHSSGTLGYLVGEEFRRSFADDSLELSGEMRLIGQIASACDLSP